MIFENLVCLDGCSYALALEFQQKVIDAWGSHGPTAEDELRNARHMMEELKKKARAAAESSTKTEQSEVSFANKT